MTDERSNEELVADIQSGRDSGESLSRLWEQVRPFVCQIANKYHAGDQTEDLIQEGFFGIMDAVRKYDAEYKAKFLTFAEYDIRRRMNRYLNDFGAITLPAWMTDAARKYKKVVAEFEKANGREPSDLETAFLLGMKVDRAMRWVQKLNVIRDAAKRIESLDAPLGDDDKLTLADVVAGGTDPAEVVEDELYQEQLRRDVWAAVDTLPAEQAEVLARHYRDGSTHEAIDADMKLRKGQSRQLCAKGLRMLRSDKSIVRNLRRYYIDLYGISLRGSLNSFFTTGFSSTERAALMAMGEHWKKD